MRKGVDKHQKMMYNVGTKEREVIIMTMYPFNRINRNWDKRLALHNKASALLEEAEKQMELAIDIEDDDEWEARNDEIKNTIMKRFWEIYKTEFALCYPESRNEWFANFVSSFADGCTQISEKQYRIFARYCEENEETWRSHERYCRMEDRLIRLKWQNNNRSVTIERFNTNVKELLA